MAECTYVQFLISFLQLVGYHSVRMSMDNPKRKIHKVYYNMGSDSERITEIVNLSESKGYSRIGCGVSESSSKYQERGQTPSEASRPASESKGFHLLFLKKCKLNLDFLKLGVV